MTNTRAGFVPWRLLTVPRHTESYSECLGTHTHTKQQVSSAHLILSMWCPALHFTCPACTYAHNRHSNTHTQWLYIPPKEAGWRHATNVTHTHSRVPGRLSKWSLWTHTSANMLSEPTDSDQRVSQWVAEEKGRFWRCLTGKRLIHLLRYNPKTRHCCPEIWLRPMCPCALGIQVTLSRNHSITLDPWC